jgi:hypothetical protein
MKIIVDSWERVVSIDGVARVVEFPIEYAEIETVRYDTDNPPQNILISNKYSVGHIIGVAFQMWHTAIANGVAPTPYHPLDLRLRGADGKDGIRGVDGVQGIQGIRGINGDGSESISDPLAYYILAKN